MSKGFLLEHVFLSRSRSKESMLAHVQTVIFHFSFLLYEVEWAKERVASAAETLTLFIMLKRYGLDWVTSWATNHDYFDSSDSCKEAPDALPLRKKATYHKLRTGSPNARIKNLLCKQKTSRILRSATTYPNEQETLGVRPR